VAHTIRNEIADVTLAEEMIQGLNPEPLGTASLAQVHASTLSRSGQTVAIKVQHGNLVNVIASDLFVIKWLDRAASELFREDNFSLADAVSEFEQNLKQELDFVREAHNAERARNLIEHHPTLKDRVWVPRVHKEMSSERVLTMELIHGVPIRKADPGARRELARTVVDLFAAMIFTFGFLHSDPHFGNFLVCDGGKKLALLDHGLYRELDPVFMRNHALLWKSMSIGDVAGVANAATGMGAPQYGELLPLILMNRPVQSRARIGSRVPQDELAQVRRRAGFETGMSLAQFAEIAHDVPVDLLFVLRTMHLIKDLHLELGGTSRDRLLTYTSAAVAFPDTIPPQSWSGTARMQAWKATFVWNEAKLWVWQWLFYSRDDSEKGGRFSLSGLMREKLEGAKEKPGKMFGAMKLWKRAKAGGRRSAESDKDDHNGKNVNGPVLLGRDDFYSSQRNLGGGGGAGGSG
jgi:aarF domain-containing kinase